MRPGAISYDDAVASGSEHVARVDAAMDALAEYEEARVYWIGQSWVERVYINVPDGEPPPLGSRLRPDLQEEATAAIDAFEAEAFEIVRALLAGRPR